MIEFLNRKFTNKCYTYGRYVGFVKRSGSGKRKSYAAYSRKGEFLGSAWSKEDAYEIVFTQ